MHHQLECKQISDSQAFQSTQESNVIHSDNFLLHRGKLGLQRQKVGAQLHALRQHRTATRTNMKIFKLVPVNNSVTHKQTQVVHTNGN